jgi:CRISPR-associated protein Cas5d
MKYPNVVDYCVYGKFALFTDPITKMGGEKYSYPIPTYEALKGITESIYWKPSFDWVIDRVRILHLIEMQAKGIRPLAYSGGNTLSLYTYLFDVAYQVETHFEWNMHRPDLAVDRIEDKHYQIARRMIEKGGRRDIFLGTRECQGYVEPCVFGEGEGAYDQENEMPFALMFHGFTYPSDSGDDKLIARFWQPKMVNGVIEFLRPEECSITREIRNYQLNDVRIGKNYSIDGEEE